MEFVNLCHHPVIVYWQFKDEQISLPPCPAPARTIFKDELISHCVKRKVVEGIENLPEEKEWTVYVVSNVVRASLPNRKDLASPGWTEIRDGKRGCRYLIIN